MSSFAAEPILFIGTLPITNTLLHTLIVDALLVLAAYFISKNNSRIPGLFQNIVELVIDTFYTLTESVSETRAAQIFPYFMSFFLFILIANWTSLFPGFGTIGFNRGHDFVPLLRGATSDINVTLSLALISLVATHMLSLRYTGIKDYLSRFFSLNPIFLFVGLLEIVSEITKLVSLSFRLFGNVFAGEVVLHTVSNIFAFIFPLPFITLEIIVGLVQALVFGMLTMAFMAILTTPHHVTEHVKHA